MPLPLSFTAPVISGAGQGRMIGTPTLNLDLESVPAELDEGIYACWVNAKLKAVMHYGPRPAMKLAPSCEVHLLDHIVETPPKTVTVTAVQRLRDIADFSSMEALKAQIAQDIADARGILGVSP